MIDDLRHCDSCFQDSLVEKQVLSDRQYEYLVKVHELIQKYGKHQVINGMSVSIKLQESRMSLCSQGGGTKK